MTASGVPLKEVVYGFINALKAEGAMPQHYEIVDVVTAFNTSGGYSVIVHMSEGEPVRIETDGGPRDKKMDN